MQGQQNDEKRQRYICPVRALQRARPKPGDLSYWRARGINLVEEDRRTLGILTRARSRQC